VSTTCGIHGIDTSSGRCARCDAERTRTISLTLTSGQYDALAMAAFEGADSPDMASARDALEQAWAEQDAVHFRSDDQADEAGPGGTPKVTIRLTTEISGEWVSNEVVAYTVRQLAAAMAGQAQRGRQRGRQGGNVTAKPAAPDEGPGAAGRV
jgi:hypothetical protein